MTYQRFEDLPVWQAAIQLGVRTYDLTGTADYRGHGSLPDQIERASVSVSNNIAKGFEHGTTAESLSFLYIARGSAGEVRSLLCLLEQHAAFKNLKFEILNLKLLAENISRQLRGWADKLQNSTIRGQRHLTDRDRQAAERPRSPDEFLEYMRRIQEDGKAAPPPEPSEPSGTDEP